MGAELKTIDGSNDSIAMDLDWVIEHRSELSPTDLRNVSRLSQISPTKIPIYVAGLREQVATRTAKRAAPSFIPRISADENTRPPDADDIDKMRGRLPAELRIMLEGKARRTS